MKNINHYVETFPTVHENGFTHDELLQVLRDFPTMNKKKFFSALDNITGERMPNGDFITYHCDVELAINSGTYRPIFDEDFD